MTQTCALCTQPGSSRTSDDAGGLSAGLIVVEDGSLAAVGGAEAEALAHRGATGAAALAALEHAAGALVGLDTPDTVAAGACCRLEESLRVRRATRVSGVFGCKWPTHSTAKQPTCRGKKTKKKKKQKESSCERIVCSTTRLQGNRGKTDRLLRNQRCFARKKRPTSHLRRPGTWRAFPWPVRASVPLGTCLDREQCKTPKQINSKERPPKERERGIRETSKNMRRIKYGNTTTRLGLL